MGGPSRHPEVGFEGSPVGKGEHPNHVVVNKYISTVGNSKRVINEYYSGISCSGRPTIDLFGECETPHSPLFSSLISTSS
ncbi:hypothetical protein PM082_004861 [Marasmius tenuissimus]|nr:hypothetical protein PM082_004861 [Marasmius tenuissimus]